MDLHLPQEMRERLDRARVEVIRTAGSIADASPLNWISRELPHLTGDLEGVAAGEIAQNEIGLRAADAARPVCAACRGIDACALGTSGIQPVLSRLDARIVVRDVPCRYRVGRQTQERAIERSGIEPGFQGRTFATFTSRPGTEAALTAATRVAEHEDGRGLYLYGNPGGGKTHLAAAIFWRKTERGIPTLFHRASVLFMRLRGTFRGDGQTDLALIEEVSSVPLLVLDDADKIGTGSRNGIMSEHASEAVWTILDMRSERRLQTVLTGNCGPAALADRCGADYGPAIFSRIAQYDIVSVGAADMRIDAARCRVAR